MSRLFFQSLLLLPFQFAQAQIGFSSSTMVTNTRFQFSKPYYAIDGKRYRIHAESFDGVCVQFGLEYAITYRVRTAWWGDFAAVPISKDGAVGAPSRSREVLDSIVCGLSVGDLFPGLLINDLPFGPVAY